MNLFLYPSFLAFLAHSKTLLGAMALMSVILMTMMTSWVCLTTDLGKNENHADWLSMAKCFHRFPVRTWVNMCVAAWTHTCRGQKTTSGAVSLEPSTLLWGGGVSHWLVTQQIGYTSWPAIPEGEIFPSSPPRDESIIMHHHTRFFHVDSRV